MDMLNYAIIATDCSDETSCVRQPFFFSFFFFFFSSFLDHFGPFWTIFSRISPFFKIRLHPERRVECSLQLA